jgi:hypothetical protein
VLPGPKKPFTSIPLEWLLKSTLDCKSALLQRHVDYDWLKTANSSRHGSKKWGCGIKMMMEAGPSGFPISCVSPKIRWSRRKTLLNLTFKTLNISLIEHRCLRWLFVWFGVFHGAVAGSYQTIDERDEDKRSWEKLWRTSSKWWIPFTVLIIWHFLNAKKKKSLEERTNRCPERDAELIWWFQFSLSHKFPSIVWGSLVNCTTICSHICDKLDFNRVHMESALSLSFLCVFTMKV